LDSLASHAPIKVVLECCHIGGTELSQCSYNGVYISECQEWCVTEYGVINSCVTVFLDVVQMVLPTFYRSVEVVYYRVSQYFYNGFVVIHYRVLQYFSKCVTSVLQVCYKCVTSVLPSNRSDSSC
jgi:hypothetical protein